MKDEVCILLCTYNGAKYLSSQLQSYVDQTWTRWSLHVSDDGSMDATLDILRGFADAAPNPVHVFTGPCSGFAANFLHVLKRPEIKGSWYAFSDQDDVWLPDKLERGVAWLSSIPLEIPALYGARTCVVDEELRPIGMSPLFRKPPGFQNAIIQNIAGGNTMMFNHAARECILNALGDSPPPPYHDWWTYIIVSGCGGNVFYDPVPSILYRQHGLNLIGKNTSFRSKLTRLRKLLRGEYKSWNTGHLALLERCAGMLSPENREVYRQFLTARELSPLNRLIAFKKAGLYHQNPFGAIIFQLACILGKV